jgi:general secretion pathway protein F
LSLSEAEAARLSRDLAQLLTSGLSISQALGLIISRETPKAAAVAREVRTQLMAGVPLSSALDCAEGQASRLLQALARGGEASGRQAEVLAAGAASLAASSALKRRMLTLSLYPLFVILVALGSIAVYAYAVLPALEPAFDSLGDQLPLQTKAVLAFGALVRAAFPALGAILLSASLLLALSPRLRASGRDLFANLLMRGRRSPVRDYLFAGLASRLAVLLKAGVPLGVAWRLSRDAVSIGSLSRQLSAQDHRLMEGARLSDAFAAVPATPADLIHYVSLGEHSGRLSPALEDGSSAIGQRAQEAVERLLAVATPLIIVAIGAMVGVITMMVFQGLLAVGDAVSS